MNVVLLDLKVVLHSWFSICHQRKKLPSFTLEPSNFMPIKIPLPSLTLKNVLGNNRVTTSTHSNQRVEISIATKVVVFANQSLLLSHTFILYVHVPLYQSRKISFQREEESYSDILIIDKFKGRAIKLVGLSLCLPYVICR